MSASSQGTARPSDVANELLRGLNRCDFNSLPPELGLQGEAGKTRWAILMLVLTMIGPNLKDRMRDGTPALGLSAKQISQSTPWAVGAIRDHLAELEKHGWLRSEQQFNNAKLLTPLATHLETLESHSRVSVGVTPMSPWRDRVTSSVTPMSPQRDRGYVPLEGQRVCPLGGTPNKQPSTEINNTLGNNLSRNQGVVGIEENGRPASDEREDPVLTEKVDDVDDSADWDLEDDAQAVEVQAVEVHEGEDLPDYPFHDNLSDEQNTKLLRLDIRPNWFYVQQMGQGATPFDIAFNQLQQAG